jgi:histidinol-phosphate/aromatic aminotransferase/cobyric acid decarboxylase-like protein
MKEKDNIQSQKGSNEIFDAIISHVKDVLSPIPEYGTCGIEITFHDGKPVKITKTVGISLKP